METRKRKSPAKGITLPKGWLKKTEVKESRELLLRYQGGKCAISGVALTTGALDHDHSGGHIRGVLLSEINMLEGRYLKLFNKLKLKEKYGIDFADMLFCMGQYLKEDYSDNDIHFGVMEAFRKKINRLTKPVLESKLLSDYGITSTGDKKELVRLYVQAWVDNYNERRNNYE